MCVITYISIVLHMTECTPTIYVFTNYQKRVNKITKYSYIS